MKAKKTANGNMPKGYETRDQFIQTLKAIEQVGLKAGWTDDQTRQVILDAVSEVFPNLDLSDDSDGEDSSLDANAIASDVA